MTWEPAYALLIAASTAIDWMVATRMPGAQASRKRWLMAASLTVNLGLLFSFKYYNLINGSFTALAAAVGVDWPLRESNFLLPVGISFYTFQTLGYTIDVYRGKQAPEPHLGRFALYVSYFPQLVAGPIERAGRLLPQLAEDHDFDADRLTSGLRLMAWGLFKKVVVADRLSVFVDGVYGQPAEHSGPMMVLATFFFGFQVYCDFSGYSDIAIGCARIMGVDLMKNFDQPHLARSVAEFWGRWHISLITWFRDYVYFPMGGSRHGNARTVFNVLFVFGLSGLWHGASWTFLIWGLINGAYILVGRVTADARESIALATGFDKLVRVRATWQVVSAVGITYCSFIFFRADTMAHAMACYARVPHGWAGAFRFETVFWELHSIGLEVWMFLFMLALIPLTELVEFAFRHGRNWRQPPTWLRWSGDYALLFGVLLLGRFDREAFVYFQF
jgi:D-alanyl-lipoteichoic acid acyltransferase DltB (MBOAT superfamily)